MLTHAGLLEKTAIADRQKKQVNTIAMITFWGQFSNYVFNTILILYLTRPVLAHGLGYSEANAYLFYGIMQAMGYIMPAVGGQIADKLLGLTRSILFGSVLLAVAYLLVMLSGVMVPWYGDKLFIAACALLPVMNSLLIGTASSVVSKIYADDEAKAKAGMTLYYMSINVGALLATILAPQLLESRYGPLSIFAVVFIGKSVSALNYAWRYSIYTNVSTDLDKQPLTINRVGKLAAYLISFYLLALYVYFNPQLASVLIGLGGASSIGWFLYKTFQLQGPARKKQLIAVVLMFEAVVFFVLYNQMNTTLILFAKKHSDLHMLGVNVSPAHYQLVNPLLIILLSMVLPAFYKKFPRFTIPLQFAAGTFMGGLGLIMMYVACVVADGGLINGNFFILTYALLTLAELWVSAVGMSMIGLYCHHDIIAFAMGVWLIAMSLSNILSSHLAQIVALPSTLTSSASGITIYKFYYFDIGIVAIILSMFMGIFALKIGASMKRQGIHLA